ncbi:MAG TPA: methyl-accepting chemotaxis protein [Gemmatimonadales bacterium]|nr:methyl-accepting chemotaxis protein [Gemmatimonadales bacterium]
MASRTQQLRQSVLVTGAVAATALVVVLAIIAGNTAGRILKAQADDRGRDVGTRVAAIVTQYLHERRHEAEALALSPAVVAAAVDAEKTVSDRNLTKLDIPALERTFNQSRALGATPELAAFLRTYSQRSDFAEIFFTESHGYNVLSSDRTSDFVQSDEEWWQRAQQDGLYEGEPTYDSSASAVSMEYDVAIRAPRVARPVGVLKAVFALDHLSRLLAAADLGGGAYLQVVDGQARIVVGPDPKLLLHALDNEAVIPRSDRPAVVVLDAPRGEELVVSVPANGGKWWVLFRQPTATAYSAARATQRTIWFGAIGLLAIAILILWVLARQLHRRVTEPVRAAGALASRIASGDLSTTVVSARSEAAEVSDLLASVHAMVVALRKLVGAIRSAADEAAAMASEISASTEEMSASTQEMAATCQDLTRRAAEQAQLVRAAADDAGKILAIATILASGSGEAARRNASLATLAREHKQLLDESTNQLARLGEEVDKGGREAEDLARASAEIQKFVTQAKAVATQTNMLALNAALEAARAGPQGRGFAVVADEVRKLASVAAGSAGDTADTVRGVLARVENTRDRLARIAQAGAAARGAARAAAEGLATVANEADANDVWSKEIANSAGEVRTLVEEIAARLATVAQGTDNLLASAEEIAASSQEQSASTQEIASSANQLAQAADHLTGAVKTFRLLSDEEPPPAPAPEAQAAD